MEASALADPDMNAVLGIDAAWTVSEPSGIALVKGIPGRKWQCVVLSPSYSTFMDGGTADWRLGRIRGAKPEISSLMEVARRIAGRKVDLITVDMPVSKRDINGRREADDAISGEFGKYGCGTHTPSIMRPGRLGAELSASCNKTGFPIATKNTPCGQRDRLIEVYPHPALLRLLHADYRVPYKAGNTARYWPGVGALERRRRLLEKYEEILRALSGKISDIPLDLPLPMDCTSFAYMKRFEDALDALVCAWVGIMYLEGKATAYGDNAAAIWVPSVDQGQKTPELQR